MGSTKRAVVERVLGAGAVDGLVIARSKVNALARTRLHPEGRRSAHLLRELRDRHRGELCVIIGNGPSLNDTELHLLEGVQTFGLNRIFLMFPKLGFVTSYHVVVNRLVVEQSAPELCSVGSPLFTTWENRSDLATRPSTVYLQALGGLGFSEDVTRGVWEGSTVTYVAMQLAYYFGFERVVLVGVDHRFKDQGPAHRVVTSAAADSNHFDPNYFGPGFRWQLPDLEASELAYRLARQTFEASGRSIVDATVGGALTVFPKMTLAEALS